MRWFWFDRYTEFESGRHAIGIKNVSLSEEHLHDHFPGAPTMPNSLIIEGLAQCGGLLVGEARGFERRVVLGKLTKAKFHFAAIPGDTLIYRTEILAMRDDGAMVEATAHVGERLQAEVEISFAYLSGKLAQQALFDQGDLLTWLRAVKLFEVGRTADGRPIPIPPLLVEHDRYATAV